MQAKLDIMIDVLTGLTFAHKRGIIHRDIKPANIRVTEEGRAKIMDFGVAHLASSSMTTTGSLLGTPSFMAPEQVTEGKTTPGTDIFAVGGVLYQLLTNLKPFEGPTLQNLFFKIITEKPKRVSELMPGLPPALDRIVDKAMAKEPADRYTNALDMANDLSAVRAKLSGPSYPESVSLSFSVSSAIEQARKKQQTRTRSLAFAGGFAAAAAILIGWGILFKIRHPSPADDKPATAAATSAQTPVSSQQSTVPPMTAFPAPPAAEKSAATTQSARSTRTVTPTKTAVKTPPPKVAQKPAQSPVVSAPAPTNQIPTAVTQQQVVTQPPPVVVQRQAQAPAQEVPPPAPAPKPATAADIAPIVEAYARAIESRDINAMRRINPGLTPAQQRNFETFFQRARDINVTFKVDNVEGSTSSADARVVGTYAYTDSQGNAVRQPVSLAATLQRDGNAWRLIAIR
ncbi:MAG: hypothetical protein DMD63_13795 [Gemmatimonadetes bacterium]|nr:MAG: hypothetical protein DMD63_13795 [Gemmatimonadota bacterium]